MSGQGLRPKEAGAAGAGPLEYRLGEQVGHLLRRAHQRATAIFLEEIGDPRVTPTQFAAMVRLLEEGELSQNHLGRLTAMDPATIQGVIRRLSERRLIARRQDLQDRRRTLLRLSPAGEALIRRLIGNGPKVTACILEPLTPGETRQFLALLRRLT